MFSFSLSLATLVDVKYTFLMVFHCPDWKWCYVSFSLYWPFIISSSVKCLYGSFAHISTELFVLKMFITFIVKVSTFSGKLKE